MPECLIIHVILSPLNLTQHSIVNSLVTVNFVKRFFYDFYFVHLFNQLAQLITNAGGVGAVVDYIKESKGNVRLPGIMMLGYVAAHSETLAMSVIVSKVRGTVHLYGGFISWKNF